MFFFHLFLLLFAANKFLFCLFFLPCPKFVFQIFWKDFYGDPKFKLQNSIQIQLIKKFMKANVTFDSRACIFDAH